MKELALSSFAALGTMTALGAFVLGAVGLAGCSSEPGDGVASVATDTKGSVSTIDAVSTAWEARLDPDMRAVVDRLASLGGKPVETLGPVEARAQPTLADAVNAIRADRGVSPLFVRSTEERPIPARTGAGTSAGTASLPKLTARIYTPEGLAGPAPVIVYYHGGGFVLATLDTYDASARALAVGASAIVVSVDYRKAPENVFPTAHDDAFDAYRWVLAAGATFGADTKRVAVVGEGAGGNLAANVTIAARDAGIRVPVAQVLVYPITTGRADTPSAVDNAGARPLDRAMLPWFLSHYERTPADGKDPRIALVAANLAKLPPTTIVNAEVDPLRTDGEELYAALKGAGVAVEQRTFTGVTHDFFGAGQVVGKAREAEDFAVRRLRAAF